MIVTARSYLTAGLAAALVAGTAGAVDAAPQSGPALSTIAFPAIDLAAAVAPLLEPLGAAAQTAATGVFVGADVGGVTESPGDWIINAYNVIQPWVEYGVELFAWATEWLPWPIGLLAPQADIIYSGWQPFAESVVYSFAFLIDGQFDLVLPTLSAGIQVGVTNLIQGEIAWIASFFPPLPPIGGAAATRTAARSTQPAPAAAEATEATEAAAAAETATAAAVETQSAPVAVTQPETAVQPARRAVRGAPRMSQSAASASAASSASATAQVAEVAEAGEAVVAEAIEAVEVSVPPEAIAGPSAAPDATASKAAKAPAAPAARKAARSANPGTGSDRAAGAGRTAR